MRKATSKAKAKPKSRLKARPRVRAKGRKPRLISRDSAQDFGDEITESEAPRLAVGRDRSRQQTKVTELTWARFDALVQEMARSIRRKMKPDAVVGVAHGGVFVGGAVAS